MVHGMPFSYFWSCGAVLLMQNKKRLYRVRLICLFQLSDWQKVRKHMGARHCPTESRGFGPISLTCVLPLMDSTALMYYVFHIVRSRIKLPRQLSARRNSRFKSRRSILERSDLKEGLNEMICAKRWNPQWIYIGTVHLYGSRYPMVPQRYGNGTRT